VIVVDKDRLYNVHRRYETTRDARVVKEIVNNGRAAPVVTREVVQGANAKMERHFARSGDFSRKPNADAVNEFASRRRGSAGATATAQTAAPVIQKASIKTDAKAGPTPAIAKSGDESKRTLPETPRELRREQRQERRLEASTGKSVKESPGPGRQALPQQQKQQVQEPQQRQQRIQQETQQRRQQQFERQQQQQLMQEQQRVQRQQQLQAQQQQRQQAQQQQQAQRQQQQQQQREQQGQQRQSQKKGQRQQQPQQ
jgi:hypothetical protein